jgi:hypothetical protein
MTTSTGGPEPSRMTPIECVCTGHHAPIPSVKVRNASSGGDGTVTARRIGSSPAAGRTSDP